LGIVSEIVIEQHVDVAGLCSQPPDWFGETRQLVLGIQIVKPLGRRGKPFLVPGLPISSMEADDGNWSGDFPKRGNAAGKPLGFIDNNMSKLVPPLEIQHAFAMLRIEPRFIAKLDGELIASEDRLAGSNVVEIGRAVDEPGRKLEQHGAELARFTDRLDGRAKSLPQLIEQLCRYVAIVEGLLFDWPKASRMSFGKAEGGVWCWVKRRKAFTSKRKFAGVRLAQSIELRAEGRA
jgi:hypothetical protein